MRGEKAIARRRQRMGAKPRVAQAVAAPSLQTAAQSPFSLLFAAKLASASTRHGHCNSRKVSGCKSAQVYCKILVQ